MILDLSPIINYEGKRLDFDTELDFSDAKDTGLEFAGPIKLSGSVMNMGGRLELSAKAGTELACTCDRCLETFEREFECAFEEILKKEELKGENDENPDVVYFRGNSIELDELVLGNVIIALPSKSLCKEDCKGLCPECGQNLNNGECGCDTRAVDPRFDVLDKFFE